MRRPLTAHASHSGMDWPGTVFGRAGALGLAVALTAGALTAMVAQAPPAAASNSTTPPFTECPAVRADSSCAILIEFTDSGVIVHPPRPTAPTSFPPPRSTCA